MNKEARSQFLRFATMPESAWRGNFRDLNAAVTRMATLAPHGRIRVDEVEAEKGRLRSAWQRESEGGDEKVLRSVWGAERMKSLDPFDRVQLAYVVGVCREAKSISEAGRQMFAVSRGQKKSSNDSDRLRKYLGKFGLEFVEL